MITDRSGRPGLGQENAGLGDEKLRLGTVPSRPFSMLYPGTGRVFFPPLVKGGQGGLGRTASAIIPAQPIGCVLKEVLGSASFRVSINDLDAGSNALKTRSDSLYRVR
jgi:hypothetical protein